MRSRPTATIALLQLVSIVSVASQPPLDQLGQPFASTNCAITWAVTNKLPEKLWVCRVLPSNFSPRVISNLVALGEFSPKEKVDNLGWQHNDLRSRCYSNDKRSLGIYPRYGFIEYRYPKANDFKTEKGVPTEEEARRLGTDWVGLLALDRSQISEINVYTPVHLQFRHEPYYRVITNINSRDITFGRRFDGLDFYMQKEGCRIQFAHHAVVSQIYLSWRNLERDKRYPVAKPEVIMKWMREGKCFWQPWHPDAQHLDSSCFTKVTVHKVTLYYYGNEQDEQQDWVCPFAHLETTVEMNVTTGVIPEGEVRVKPADFTNIFKIHTESRTISPVFMCCPIIEDKRAQP